MRVERMSFHHAEGRRGLYDVTLSLTNKGLASNLGGSSGDPGDFPYMPSPTSVVQTGCGNSLGGAVALTFPDPVSEGHLLVAWLVARSGGPSIIAPPSGWTQIAQVGIVPGDDAPAAMYYKLADSGDNGATTFGFTASGGSSRPKILGWELEGVGAPTTFVTRPGELTGSPSFTFPTLTTGAGIVIACAGTLSDSPEPASITPSDHFYVEAGDHFWQTALGADQVVDAGSHVYSVAFTVSGGGSDHDGVAAFFPATTTDNPPAPGQWVRGEIPTPAPDGTTTTFSTVFPYANGSLSVTVDGLSGGSVIEDGAAGTFTMAWAPDVGETIRVDYQGR